jgi:hypothetical protein
MTDVQLNLTEEERQFLIELLQESLKEIEIEEHRTKTFGYRKLILNQEVMIQRLLDRLRQAKP